MRLLSQKLWSIGVVAALFLASVITSCAYQPKVGEPLLSQQGKIQPIVTSEPLQQEQRTLAGHDKESNCILTTHDIHLWCNWIAQYY
jgi:hypothetical protein